MLRGSVAVALAFLLDGAFGDPPDAFHPVAWMGMAIARAKGWALRGTPAGQLARGALVAVTIPACSAAVAYAALRLARPAPLVELVLAVLVLKSTFAARSLRTAAYVVRDALDRGDLPAARRGLGSLCSRGADELEEGELVAATIESVAENTSDSVVAPLLCFACAGVPGAVFYRAVNTLDAMVGYRGRLEYAGKASARLDDLLNLIPARLTALLLLAAGRVQGHSVRDGLRIALRDARRTESPNAGWPMAAMAGLLGVCLTKRGHYALGDATRPLVPAQITSACRASALASVFTVALVAVALEWVRG